MAQNDSESPEPVDLSHLDDETIIALTTAAWDARACLMQLDHYGLLGDSADLGEIYDMLCSEQSIRLQVYKVLRGIR